MDRTKQIAGELQILRTICNEAESQEGRWELLRSYGKHQFADPEHHVVFESIHRLFERGSISAARLAVHLNNRGFPDIDIARYFPAAYMNDTPHKSTNKRPVRRHPGGKNKVSRKG